MHRSDGLNLPARNSAPSWLILLSGTFVMNLSLRSCSLLHLDSVRSTCASSDSQND